MASALSSGSPFKKNGKPGDMTQQAKMPMAQQQGEADEDSYAAGFRSLQAFVRFQMFVILVLSLVLYFYINKVRPEDRHFAETLEGKRMQMAALETPNMNMPTLRAWVQRAATEIMTFGFNDFDRRFNETKHNFTPEGWESFRAAMIESGLIQQVQEAQQILTAIPREEPTLYQEGVESGRYKWVFDLPLLVTYRAGSAKKTDLMPVRITIERMPTRDNPTGIGISHWTRG
jgi:intracellular multiplication protein IcmL